ncbi:MAG: Maf family protein [Planctomycetaceae bacterium]|jgi:septum formation protein|nr:Maf family protein [Planctomycetaceae bacterium]
MNIICNDNYDYDKKLERLYLASQSPRRRELMANAGLQFEIIPPDENVEDERKPYETPSQYVCRLAIQKARNVAGKIECGRIIACDTVACCGEKLLGKPIDKNDARRMLKFLRGKKHYVISGLCLLAKKNNKLEQLDIAAEQTELVMQQITDEDIESYLDGNSWIGKAGAFGYQDNNSWIKIINGSESNVVGLPLERLQELLTHVTK